MKFQLLGGKHQDSLHRKYKPGDIIESEKDLEAMFFNKFKRVPDDTKARNEGKPDPARETVNILDRDGWEDDQSTTPGVVKLTENKPEGKPVLANPEDEELDLDSMNVKELQALAEEREIDLRGAGRKDVIIKMIKEATKTVSA